MSTPSDAAPESRAQAQGIASATVLRTQPLYWSVQREIWENRSIYVAPFAVASVLLFGFLLSSGHLPRSTRSTLALDAGRQHAAIVRPYDFAGFAILLTGFLVGVFYCLDALYGERRDRSILFWKSLPVSDFTTVLSKALIPLAVLPALGFVLIAVTQMIMLLLSTAVLSVSGLDAGILWNQFHFGEQLVALFYGMTAIALWHAPIYAWLLVVSGWARRTVFLWAFLPPLLISMLERGAFGTTRFLGLLQYRLVGWVALVFNPQGGAANHPLAQLTPGKFLSTPGLWLGLVFAALCLWVAARLRRDRGPI